MLRKGKINLRKPKILGMYAIDQSTARPKWRQTPVTAYICLYQELNLKIVEYTSPILLILVAEYLRTLGAKKCRFKRWLITTVCDTN